MDYHFYESLYKSYDDFKRDTPIKRLENFYKVLVHRKLHSTDSMIMKPDLEEFRKIVKDIKESEVA